MKKNKAAKKSKKKNLLALVITETEPSSSETNKEVNTTERVITYYFKHDKRTRTLILCPIEEEGDSK